MWKSIINEEKEQAQIRKNIDDIYKSLTLKVKITKGFNLYGERSGLCLFFAFYQSINNQSIKCIENIIPSIIDDAYQYKITDCKDLTFISEMAWLICHLYEKKMIDIDINNYFSGIDESLYEGMIILLNRKEYGCINGAISIAMYFYYRYIIGSTKSKTYLEQFVTLLRKISIEKKDEMKWISIINYRTYEQGCNLGIAHGIPGILLFLRKLHIVNIKKDDISDIIIKTSNFLLQQKHSLKKHKSFFYSSIGTGSIGNDTRLGWCYGDLGVGYSLFMISSLDGISRQDIKENAIDILLKTTDRISLSENGITDAGLCHGTAGIAHIYNRLYHQTEECKFKEAALYWYKETIKMAKYDNEYAGYNLSYFSTEEEMKLAKIEKKIYELNNLSFLTGIAGTGLSLLSAVYPKEPSWDQCLLLS